jgi:hypothetical protein
MELQDRAHAIPDLSKLSGVQYNGDNTERCYAAGRNDKPYSESMGAYARNYLAIEGELSGVYNPLNQLQPEFIRCEARPKDFQDGESYHPYIEMLFI